MFHRAPRAPRPNRLALALPATASASTLELPPAVRAREHGAHASARYIPTFTSIHRLSGDSLFRELVLPFALSPMLAHAIGRRLLQRDPAIAWISDLHQAKTTSFLGAVCEITETEEEGDTALYIEVRVPAPLAPDTLIFRVVRSDARDLSNRLEYGHIVGFSIRHDPAFDLLALHAERKHLIPHAFLYAP